MISKGFVGLCDVCSQEVSNRDHHTHTDNGVVHSGCHSKGAHHMTNKLKPCPFCGGEVNLSPPTCNKDTPYNASDKAFPSVFCIGCFASVPGVDWDHSGNTAVERWNARAELESNSVAICHGVEYVIKSRLDAAEKRIAELESKQEWVSVEKLDCAISAMERAKKLPIWDFSVPALLHRELDVIFKFLSDAKPPEAKDEH